MKALILYLAILNTVDGILSYIGLRFEFIKEMNLLMSAVYMVSPSFFLFFKVALSVILLFFFGKIHGKSLAGKLALAAALCYTGVIVMHGYWLLRVI